MSKKEFTAAGDQRPVAVLDEIVVATNRMEEKGFDVPIPAGLDIVMDVFSFS